LFDFPKGRLLTSYRTGDERWLVDNGYFTILKPTNAKVIADLDYAISNYFYQLKENLIVNSVISNTRFVDVDGGQTFSATGNKNAVVIDKLSGLMFNRLRSASNLTWDNAVDAGLSYSIVVDSITYDDWHLITLEEFNKIFGSQGGGNWTDPITSNLLRTVTGGSSQFWTSTTNETTSTQAYTISEGGGSNTIVSLAKTSSIRQVFVRDCRNLITAP
jgi:hypothetical protein